MIKLILFMSCLLFTSVNISLAQPGWTFHKNADIPVNGMSFCIQTDYVGGGVYLGLTGGLTKHNGFEWLRIYYNEIEPNLHSNEYNVRKLSPNGAYMWAGTNAGIIRFDGYEKKIYNSQNTKNMTEDHIRGLTPDKEGNLWYLSQTLAISKIDVAADTVINYVVPHTFPIPFINDAKMFTDNDLRLWYYLDGKLVRFKGSTARVLDSTDIPIIKDDKMSWAQIQFDGSLAVLFARHIGIFKEINGASTFKEIVVPDTMLAADEFFKYVKIDMEGNLWILARRDFGDAIGSRHFYKLTKQGEWTKYEFPFIEGTISQNYSFTDFTIDLTGKIWFAEPYYGVFVFDPKFSSAKEELKNTTEIFPNPAYDFISVSNYKTSEVRYAIIDLLGREVLNGELSGSKIDISGLIPSGYFLKIGREIKPFVKSK